MGQNVPDKYLDLLELTSQQPYSRLAKKQTVRVKNAVVPGQVIFHPDSMEFWRSGELTSVVDFDTIRQFYSELNERFRPISDKHINLFVTRRSTHRNLLNILFLEKIFSRLGYEIIDFSDLSVLEQIQKVKQAKKIIMIGGASIANIVFAEPNTKVGVIYSSKGKGFTMPLKLSMVSGAHCRVFFGLPLSFFYRDKLAKVHSDYFVGLLTLTKIFKFLKG